MASEICAIWPARRDVSAGCVALLAIFNPRSWRVPFWVWVLSAPLPQTLWHWRRVLWAKFRDPDSECDLVLPFCERPRAQPLEYPFQRRVKLRGPHFLAMPLYGRTFFAHPRGPCANLR